MQVVAAVGLTLCALSVYFLIRNEWVFRLRIRWIDDDVYDFKRRAPTYDFMLYNRWWVWDASKLYPPSTADNANGGIGENNG